MRTEQEIKSLVEAIVGHGIMSEHYSSKDDFPGAGFENRQASEKEGQLEKQGVTLEEDEAEIELLHVLRDGKRWMVFDIGNWEWKRQEAEAIAPPGLYKSGQAQAEELAREYNLIRGTYDIVRESEIKRRLRELGFRLQWSQNDMVHKVVPLAKESEAKQWK